MRASPQRAGALAHLVLVPNPPQHPQGDFALRRAPPGALGRCRRRRRRRRATPFPASASTGRPSSPAAEPGQFPMLPLFRAAAAAGRLGGQLYRGQWPDIGTPERLRELDDGWPAAPAVDVRRRGSRPPGP